MTHLPGAGFDCEPEGAGELGPTGGAAAPGARGAPSGIAEATG